MADIQSMFREAWSNALSGVNAAEQEAEKVLQRIADVAGFTPEDVRRQAREFGERLGNQRRELERSVDEAVRRAASRFRIPTQDDIERLQKRLDEIAGKVDALSKDKGSP